LNSMPADSSDYVITRLWKIKEERKWQQIRVFSFLTRTGLFSTPYFFFRYYITNSHCKSKALFKSLFWYI
jgi:hypothetical protein